MGLSRAFIKNELHEAKKGFRLAIKQEKLTLVQECRRIIDFLDNLLAPAADGEGLAEIGYAANGGFRKWFKARLKRYQKNGRVLWRRRPKAKDQNKGSEELFCVWRFLRNLGEKTGDWAVAKNSREDDDVDVIALNKKTGQAISFQVTKYDPRAEEEFAKFGLAVGGGGPDALIEMAKKVIRGKIHKCQTPGLMLLLDWYMVTPKRIARLMERRFQEMPFEKLRGIYIVCPRRNIVVKAAFA
ncbi:MAG: hypothetical protein HYT79_08640 [Elusimicrobia bacterium]|nr:hypothetical protein [Elusimicrobiota bacterium]